MLLINGGDAEGLGATGMRDVHFLAADADASSVGLIDSAQKLNQRRFAGAVFA